MQVPAVVHPGDAWKVRLLTAVRHLNAAAVERWAWHTFRRKRAIRTVGLPLRPARELYGLPTLPPGLMAPAVMPPEARLPWSYTLPYYYLAGATLKLLRAFPLARELPWSAGALGAKPFPVSAEGWNDPLEDQAFCDLRLQGPDPYLLRHDRARDELVLDFTPWFEGIAPPVVARFAPGERGLTPLVIEVGGERHTPGTPGWSRAKLLTNALDARYSVFTRHLLDTHLLVGQAFALSAYALPPSHPLRSFLDLFTYGTLMVSHFAFLMLVTPSSYFVSSRFIDLPDLHRLFDNSLQRFTIDDLVVPLDLERRGVERVPDHPYAVEAREAWSVFRGFVESVVHPSYRDDDAVRGDVWLQRWYARLGSLLPGDSVAGRPLEQREQLVTLLCCLLQLQVVHEVCGEFGILGQTGGVENLRGVHLSALLGKAEEHPPLAADVFLFDQGAFAGRFNNGGNNLLSCRVARYTDDAGLVAKVGEFQRELSALDARVRARNARRRHPFLRMQPSTWELSISF